VDEREDQKRAAAAAAAELVEDGWRVGLGTGTTVAHFLPALARRGLSLTCVATSPATEEAARAIGLSPTPFDLIDRLDVAVDGADQVSPELWLVKGGGGAHTREKIAACAAHRFVVIVSADKVVPALHPPVPVEIMVFGVAATVRAVSRLGKLRRREAALTPDGNLVFDLDAEVGDPNGLAEQLSSIPGVVGHGLFPPSMVTEVLVGMAGGGVQRLVP
jgi:ribose 5-phosphate isomerase A